MLFPSEIFIFAFLPIVIVVYYALLRRNIKLKNIWLLIASLIFYAWGEPVYVFLMIGVILFNYLFGLVIEHAKKSQGAVCRVVLIITVLVNVGILGWYKYAHFVFSEINRVFRCDITLADNIVLPIGISFFTFQAMSYVFDVYRGEVTASYNPLDVGLYVAFFPQLIAGPIVRYNTVSNQINNRRESVSLFSQGVVRFLKGLVKKVIIANNMAIVADAVWRLLIGDRLEASVALAWLGAISYTLQIYYDFSGYSDMAIGLGKMFGFEFQENFKHPYTAGSVTDFWRRWHISLSGWLRDYIYIPLGGNRLSILVTVRNMFVVWIITGIWHGANWTFLVWGMMYFVVLVIEKMSDSAHGSRPWWGHLYTLFIVNIGWVIFRADSLSDAFIFVKGMFGGGSGLFIDSSCLAYIRQNALYYALAVVGCVPVLDYMESKYRDSVTWNIVYTVALGASAFVAVSFIINNAYSPFIYFNF